MKDETRIELEALITEREGMIAENQYRQTTGRGIAYDGISFDCLAYRIRALNKKPEPDPIKDIAGFLPVVEGGL